jgi:Sulfotransferase family
MPHCLSAPLEPVLDPVDIEAAIFGTVQTDDTEPRSIFILGAPRTGSTFLYQAVVSCFGLPYISNLTNSQFAATPIVGLAIQHGIAVEVAFSSAFGKTEGPFQPSEGSAVMMNWFGGGHPSQLVSTGIRDGKEEHFRRTVIAVEALYQAPLVIKNAWNCFRVPWLAGALPKARFVWIRRDIRDAALSDLVARVLTKGDACAWNSATPANVEALRRLPPAHQVVENQYEFNLAVRDGLKNTADRFIEVWYEDLLAAPGAVLCAIADRFGLVNNVPRDCARIARADRRLSLPEARDAIEDYVAANFERLHPQTYHRQELRDD